MPKQKNEVSKDFQQLLAQLLNSGNEHSATPSNEQLELLKMLSEDGAISERCKHAAMRLGILPSAKHRSALPDQKQHATHVLNTILPIDRIWDYISETEMFCLHVQAKPGGEEFIYPQIIIGPHASHGDCTPASKQICEKVHRKMLHGSAFAIILNGFAARRLLVYTYAARAGSTQPKIAKVEVELYGSERRILLTSHPRSGEEGK